MSLTPGTRLGPFAIIGVLGAGGMGEVYRARDTSLNRDVAIKVLPESFASDPDRLARFQREAQVLASLNHPHIAHIHGLEQSGGVRALVMELVEGETLDERIRRPEGLRLPGSGRPSGLPMDEALHIARQIAEALEAAHEQGIIHRDLKPANIKIRPDGTVKVLDFGLAKAMGPAASSTANAAMSPTLSMHATQAGIILGTAAYMSPEQAAGKPVDKRSDLWSFGVVLLEMLTGRRIFDGETVSHVLASVLKDEPDWSTLPVDTPQPVRRLLRRCLEKDRKRRLADAADARLELDDARTEPVAAHSFADPSVRRRNRILVAAAIGMTAVISGGVAWWTMRPAAPDVRRFAIPIDPAAPVAASNDPSIAISPDGSRLVYVTGRQAGENTSATSFMLRQFDQLEAAPIPGTERGHSPFFSPDGQWIAFFADAAGDPAGSTLKKVSLAGGPAVTITKAPSPHLGASWATDDTIVFAGPGLSRVSAAGGTPVVITRPDTKLNETRHAFPDVLPNNRGVLFTAGADNGSRIEVLRFDTGERQVVVDSGSVARYVATGHVVYSQAGRLFAVPFDQDQLVVTGAAVPVLEGVSVTADGPAAFSLSRDGSLVYLPGEAGGLDRTLVWVDLKGRETPLPAKPRPYGWVRVSPDGTRLALEVNDGGGADIWIHDLARHTQTRLTFDPRPHRFPLWTPDGRRVVFQSGTELLIKSADGTGEAERLAGSLNLPIPYSWSSDGRTLVFDVAGSQGISLLAMGGDGKAQPLIQTRFGGGRPAISPDGRWIAYQSNESGRSEVYVQPFPEVSRGRWQISADGGDSPVWSSDGRRLFYRRGGALASTLMAVTVESGQDFIPGTPGVLFEGRYDFVAGLTGLGGSRSWDIAPDGQRFLMRKDDAFESATPVANIIVVQNWFEELKRLVPAN